MRRTRQGHVPLNGQSHFEWCVAIVPQCNVAHVFATQRIDDMDGVCPQRRAQSRSA